jgi:hypothetical protein
MKKILVLFISLVLAANAWATADLDMSLQSNGEAEITIDPSDTIYVDVYVDDLTGSYDLISTGELTLTISGPAVFTQNEDLTWGNAFWSSFGQTNYSYTSNKVLRVQGGYIPTPVNTMLNMDLPGIAIDHIGIHCTGPGDVTVSIGIGGAWGLPQYYDGTTVYDESDASAAGMIIHQTPEPMTIALLGLGGLFLRKRK